MSQRLRCFNSRAREGRDNNSIRCGNKASKFQFTRPRGARLVHCIRRKRGWCFNSRAREGRDRLQHAHGGNRAHVSIHAPARGATCSYPCPRRRKGVSIHAPARGATLPFITICPRSGFNSRAREGRDVEIIRASIAAKVSIHAPARGATDWRTSSTKPRKFQFTRPRGARRRGR